MSALVVHVVGARPNYMKIAPLYAALERRGVEQRLVHTGQHYDAPSATSSSPSCRFRSRTSSSRSARARTAEQTARALDGLERVFIELEPDLVVAPATSTPRSPLRSPP